MATRFPLTSRRHFIKSGLIYVPTIFVCAQGAVRLGSLEPEVPNWLSRVRVLGGGYTSASIVASDTAMKMMKSAGVRAKLLRWNLYCGSNLLACLTPLINASGAAADSNYGSAYTDGNYSEAVGLTPTGSQSSLTGFIPATHWASDDSCGIGAYIRSKTNGTDTIMGAQSGAEALAYLNVSYLGTTNYGDLHSTTQGIVFADVAGIGHYHLNRPASNDLTLYKNGVSQAVNATPGGNRSVTYDIAVCGYNASGTISGVGQRILAGYWITTGLASTEIVPFYNAIQRANVILARNV